VSAVRPDPAALVVIVAFNAGEHLQRCVDALQAQSCRDWRAVVWDNASTDDAVERLKTDERIEIVRHPENIGFAAANNRAAARDRSRFIVTLNPDAFAAPDWLERLIAAADRYGAEGVASLQLDDADPSRLDGAGDCMSIAGIAWRGGYGQGRATAPEAPVEVFSPCAAAALYRRDAFEALGGFDERFFCYYEDVDLGFRLRLNGGRCVLEPAAVVRHVGSASTSNVSGFAEYHGARNRLWTLLRDMPGVLWPIAVPAHILVLAYVLLRSPALLRDRWRGLKDGWAGRKLFLAERRRMRSSPSVIGALSWSPLALSRRSIVTRPIPRATDRASDDGTGVNR
jgi:GT2 family glycosyltransferase